MQALKKEPKTLYKTEVAWDIEAVRWREIVCIVAVGSDGQCVEAQDFRELERGARAAGWLKPSVRWWSHYGGIYDHLLWAEHNLHRWFLSAGKAGAGQGLWAIDAQRGEDRWILRDSARLLPGSLRSIGKAFGLEKLDVDRSALHLLSLEQTLRYCRRDCEVLLRALSAFRALARQWRTPLRDTIASTAATAVRWGALPPDVWGWDGPTDEIAERAYYGGRVERFVSEAGPGVLFDINSSYPARMVEALPTRYLGDAPRPNGRDWFIAHARVEIPDTVHVPPLPHRPAAGALKGRLVFPTGGFAGWWTRDELELVEECGGRWEPLAVMHYAQEPWLRPLMEQWWTLRRDSSDEGLRYLTKLLLNSVSGKLIERGEYETLTENPAAADRAYDRGAAVREYPVRTKQGPLVLYSIGLDRAGPLRHAAGAAAVLSRSRAALWRALRVCGEPHYCDTDSVFGSGELPPAWCGTELGQWKRERAYTCAEFLSPKMYALEDAATGALYCRAKGVRFPAGRDPREVWGRVSFGLPISYDTTRGFKKQISGGAVEFARVVETRTRHDHIDKRCFAGVHSRPWNVKELPSLKPPK